MKNLNVFATFLIKYTNTCIRKGEYPDKLKTASTTPAFKEDDKHDKSNYRPASLLPTLSKIYEKRLYKQNGKLCGKYTLYFSMQFYKKF